MEEASFEGELARLTALPARHVWPHEAHSFTPWLLKNADVLGEALGMDLLLESAEHKVGGFALDLIGMDQATGDVVIVENQLEQSDHSHLGQILTYAGGTEPADIVWVATSFREEHRAALEWLNERTDPQTRFFAVEISVVRIGDSLPAPMMRLVVQPNDWGKKVRATALEGGGPGAQQLKYQELWARFLELVHEEHLGWTNSRKAPAQNWVNMPTGVGAISFGVSFGKKGLCSELYFGDADAELNAERFQRAVAMRDQVEAAFGGTLSWEPLPERKGARIAAYSPGEIGHEESWPGYLEWFVDTQVRLRSALASIGGVTALLA